MSERASKRGERRSLGESIAEGSLSLRKGVAESLCMDEAIQSQLHPRLDATVQSENASHKRYIPIIDVSNVVRFGPEARLERLQLVLAELGKRGLVPVCIADANLRHLIDEKQSYERMASREEVVQAPAGSCADSFISQTATQIISAGSVPIVVTNDRALARSVPTALHLKFVFVQIDTKTLPIFDPPLSILSMGGG